MRSHLCSKSPAVVFYMDLSGSAGRTGLQGAFRYLNGRCNWEIRIAQHTHELREALRHQIDGLIYTNVPPHTLLPDVERLPIPVVFVDIPQEDRSHHRRIDVTVHNDNAAIGNLAARHFSSLGHFRNYGFVPSALTTTWSRERGSAFADAIKRNGQVFKKFDGKDDEALGIWLESLEKPAAVFAAWDNRACEVLQQCKRRHIRIPDQVSLLGVDDDELLCALARPGLSSIRQNHELTCYRATEELDRQLRKCRGLKSCRISIPPIKVVERASTHPPAPSLILVQNALTYINDNALQGITPNDVAHSVHCSRRLLDLRFEELQGQTVFSYITQRRLNAVKKRLLDTSRKISEIAMDCGFQNPDVLKNLFRRENGISMTEWRRRHLSSKSDFS